MAKALQSLLLFLVGGGFAFGEDLPPVPPQQDVPWVASALVTPELRALTERLFGLSYGDPRGLPYRSVQLEDGAWRIEAQRQDHEVHAWTFPSEGLGTFAVAWNGLVYRVAKDLGPADLREDVRRLIREDEEQISEEKAQHTKEVADWEKKEGREYPFGWNSRTSRRRPLEMDGFSAASFWINKPIMLLRLGLHAEAQDLWRRWYEHAGDITDYDRAYDALVQEWLGCWKDRAREAHRRGDDAVALASLRFIDKALRRSGIKIQRPGRPFFGHEELLADHERRVKHPEGLRTQAGQWGLLEAMPGEDQARCMIGWLQEADDDLLRQITHRLAQLGPGALPVLLESIQTETRFTRVVPMGLRRPPAHEVSFSKVWDCLQRPAAMMAGLPHGALFDKEWALRNAKLPEKDVREGLVALLKRESAIHDEAYDERCLRYLEEEDPSLWFSAAKELVQVCSSSFGDDPPARDVLCRRIETEFAQPRAVPVGWYLMERRGAEIEALIEGRVKQLRDPQDPHKVRDLPVSLEAWKRLRTEAHRTR